MLFERLDAPTATAFQVNHGSSLPLNDDSYTILFKILVRILKLWTLFTMQMHCRTLVNDRIIIDSRYLRNSLLTSRVNLVMLLWQSLTELAGFVRAIIIFITALTKLKMIGFRQ